jgi:hypothetical protein
MYILGMDHYTTLQSRAEQSRAEQSRAEQSRAEQSRAEQSRAEQNDFYTVPFRSRTIEKTFSPFKPRFNEAEWYNENLNDFVAEIFHLRVIQVSKSHFVSLKTVNPVAT